MVSRKAGRQQGSYCLSPRWHCHYLSLGLAASSTPCLLNSSWQRGAESAEEGQVCQGAGAGMLAASMIEKRERAKMLL